MKKLLAICSFIILVGVGCSDGESTFRKYKDEAAGYTFNYPTSGWSTKFEYTEPGAPNNPDDGITQMAFNGVPVLLFHPLRDQANNAKEAVEFISNLKFPGSIVLSEKQSSWPGMIEIMTKKGLIEYDWLVLPMPNRSGYLIIEINEVFKQPYPTGLESGIEMIFGSIRGL